MWSIDESRHTSSKDPGYGHSKESTMPHRLPSYFLPFILVALSFHALGCGETRNAGPITEVELNAIFVSPPNTTADLNSDIQFVV